MYFCPQVKEITHELKHYFTAATIYSGKEHKEEAQCGQKGGQMLVFVICGFIEKFFFYQILIS